MRIEVKRKTNYEDISRRSIRKDFANANFKKLTEAPKPAHAANVKRIVSVTENSEYYKFKRYLIGKLVRIVQQATCGGNWVSFVADEDRKSLNAAAGWSDQKDQYLLYGVKYDE